MRIALVILLAGCYRSTGQPTPIANKSDVGPEAALTMTPSGVGPINSTTKVTLTGLRTILIGYDGEKLAYVVPDDQSGYVFNVHAVSPRVAISGLSWRVGRAFKSSSHLTSCECWGSNPTCYASGEHIAVNFGRGCDGLMGGEVGEEDDHPGLRVLDGEIVQRVIWSPTAFGEAEE
jgi:hypothetical protein